MRCTSFKLTMGNLENCLVTGGAYDCIARPNATFNLAQTIRKNTFEGLSDVVVWFTQDHVVELNDLLPAQCAYNGQAMPVTPMNLTSPVAGNQSTNIGLLYRP